MSIRLLCPQGHELIAEDQHAGRKIRCPACKAICPVPNITTEADLVITQTEIPNEGEKFGYLEGEQEELQNRHQKRRGNGENREKAWFFTNLGLGFHYVKLVALLPGILFYVILMNIFLIPRNRISVGLAMTVSLILLALILIVPILGLVGSFLCFRVPRRSGARKFIMISFGLDAASTLLVLVGGFFSIREIGETGTGTGDFFQGLGLLAGFGGWALFMFFLRKVALYLHDPASGKAAFRIFIFLTPVVGCGTFLCFLLIFFSRNFTTKYPIVYVFLFLKILFEALNLIGTIRQHIYKLY